MHYRRPNSVKYADIVHSWNSRQIHYDLAFSLNRIRFETDCCVAAPNDHNGKECQECPSFYLSFTGLGFISSVYLLVVCIGIAQEKSITSPHHAVTET